MSLLGGIPIIGGLFGGGGTKVSQTSANSTTVNVSNSIDLKPVADALNGVGNQFSNTVADALNGIGNQFSNTVATANASTNSVLFQIYSTVAGQEQAALATAQADVAAKQQIAEYIKVTLLAAGAYFLWRAIT